MNTQKIKIRTKYNVEFNGEVYKEFENREEAEKEVNKLIEKAKLGETIYKNQCKKIYEHKTPFFINHNDLDYIIFNNAQEVDAFIFYVENFKGVKVNVRDYNSWKYPIMVFYDYNSYLIPFIEHDINIFQDIVSTWNQNIKIK